MSEKQYISPQSLFYDSVLLARQILDSGFKPDFIIGIWRGGTPPGIVIQDFLAYHGIDTDHIPIRTARYDNAEIDQPHARTSVDGLGYLIDNVSEEDSLLLVDDVYDTGITIRDVVNELEIKARKNTPHDIRIATVYFKPLRNKTAVIPNFYVHETERWLIFPHEFQGLTMEEIATYKGEDIAKLFKKGSK